MTIEDLAGDGDHYAASVVSETFRGLSRVKQHQVVYAALRGRMGGELHALALQTSTPEQETPFDERYRHHRPHHQSDITDEQA